MTAQLNGTDFAVVDAADLEVDTPPQEVGLGAAAADFGLPRPELNGLRVKVPGHPEVYLMDQGYRRWIPDPTTYNNLFRDWKDIHEDTGVTEIPVGNPIASGAILARGSGTAPVYFVDGGVKRWVTSPAAMDRYSFNWARVNNVPLNLLAPIPTGSDIS